MADDATEQYIAGLRERAAWLAGECEKHAVLGEVVTAAHLQRVEDAIVEIACGNEYARFPPMFIYFFRAPRRLEMLRSALELAKGKMGRSEWTAFAGEMGSDNPVGPVTELSVFVAAERAGLDPRWQPTAENGKRPDFLVTLRGREVYLEVSALTQGKFWDLVDLQAELNGGVASGAGPGFQKQAHRVAGKIAEKLRQAVPGRPNVLALMFTSFAEHPIGRDWGLEIALEGPAVAGGQDYSPRHHLDSILVLDYTRPTLYISPNCLGTSRLADEERHLLLGAFTPLPFWFPGSVRDEEF